MQNEDGRATAAEVPAAATTPANTNSGQASANEGGQEGQTRMSAGECKRTQRKASGRSGGVNVNEGRWVQTGVGRCERGWAKGGQMLAGAGAAEAAATAQAATMAAADAPFSFT